MRPAVQKRRAADSVGGVSRAAAVRLSQYLRCLVGGGTVSSGQLSRAVGVSDAQVRRDLAALGHLGQRGVGYDAVGLTAAIRRVLGIDRQWRAVVVGAGNLGRALLHYRGFREQGFEIVGLFDDDPRKVGQAVDGLVVEPASRAADRVSALGAELGVLAVPSSAAQGVADVLTAAGVRGLLSFAPLRLHADRSVTVVTVDLAIQFEQLAFQVKSGSDMPKWG